MFKTRRILVPIDFSEESKLAVEWAVKLGQEEPGETTILLMHVEPFPPVVIDPSFAMADFTPDEIAKIDQEVATWQSRVPPPLSSVPLSVRGSPLEEIVKACEREKVDLVVMTTRARRGLARAVVPNLTEEVAREAPCPVLALHFDESTRSSASVGSFSRVLVPVDFSPDSNLAIDWAAHLLKGRKEPTLFLLHVLSRAEAANNAVGWTDGMMHIEWEKERQRLDQWRQELGGINIAFLTDTGSVAAAVRRACSANRIDLVVMMSRGRHGVSRLLRANTCESVVRLAPCPALVLHVNERVRQLASWPL